MATGARPAITANDDDVQGLAARRTRGHEATGLRGYEVTGRRRVMTTLQARKVMGMFEMGGTGGSEVPVDGVRVTTGFRQYINKDTNARMRV